MTAPDKWCPGCFAFTKCSARPIGRVCTGDVRADGGRMRADKRDLISYKHRTPQSSYSNCLCEMNERDVQSVLRCGRCNKPFDKREFRSRETSSGDVEFVLILCRYRIDAEKTWLLLSVANRWSHRPVSLLYFLRARKGSLRQHAA